MGAIHALTVVVTAVTAQASLPALTGLPAPSAHVTEPWTSYNLPIGPYDNGKIPAQQLEGQFSQTAWRINRPGETTLQLLQPLRDQLQAAGFSLLFECEAASCGGYDFRFGTKNLPEPNMHIDFGDYRFLAATRGEDFVSLMVSRSAQAGFVQMTYLGAAEPSTAPSPPSPSGTPAPLLPPSSLAELTSQGAVALEDLVFDTGASALKSGDYASLRDLAAWLQDHPDLSVALVGHTDASGGLETNITLSRKRAEAVRQTLLRQYGVTNTQVEAQGVGYLAPRASNQTPEGRERNRRVEVLITSTP